MRTYDFTPFARSTIGFERLFDLLNTQVADNPDNFPPYDIIRTGEDTFRISIAVAGFAASELTVTSKPNLLVISGRKAPQDRAQHHIYQGLSPQSFERRFNLADYIVVEAAGLNNGMLHINLVRQVPEAMKPRRIEIASSQHPNDKPADAKTLEGSLQGGTRAA